MDLTKNAQIVQHPSAAPAKAKRRGLNKLAGLRRVLIGARRFFLTKIMGMDISPTAEFSLSAKFDRTFPIGVHVGAYSYVAFDTAILTHDRTRGLFVHTHIGENCFIGARSIVMPGVKIGDGSVIGAGSVVTKNVPPNSIVAGNPARVLQKDIEVEAYGRFGFADRMEHELAVSGLT
jgi:acetyltransferase-like isoleucine patch superfamily enzyme